MTVAYRQPIVPHDRGRDVLATKRALRMIGYRRVGLTPVAGRNWEAAVRTVQHENNLSVDGIYGQKTHAIVAPHFDAYGRWLYNHARLRHRNAYANPFSAARVQIGRIDEGVDYHGYGPIKAIGDCVVIGKGGAGWPGGQYLLYRLTAGRHAGRYIYIAEGITIPTAIYTGRRVKAGTTICSFRSDAAPGTYPGIEFGWGSNLLNLAYAAATGEPMGPADSDSAAGLAFARFLHSLNAPAPLVAAGPEFP